MRLDETAASQSQSVNDRSVVVCIPIFNDWASAALLLEQIDVVAQGLGFPLSVLLVDDGSSQVPPQRLTGPPRYIRAVEVLQLRRNLGHQRAIAIGLAFLQVHCSCEMVLVMDGDGEDQPTDMAALIGRCRDSGLNKIVFAKRAKRSEGLVFRAGYAGYRLVHRLLTGRRVEVGNFSVVPARMLEQLVAVSELWNHYAASVFQARMPVEMLPVARGRRLAGESRMNFISLVTHGMSAISVYCDTVGVRLMCFTAVLIFLVSCSLLAAIGVRMFTSWAIPGWATAAAGLLTIMLINLFTLMLVFVLFVLQSRSATGFLPVRDWQYFVARSWKLHG